MLFLNVCSSSELVSIINVVKNIFLLIEIIVPILLIVYFAVELTKMVYNPDNKKLKKSIFNKIIAAIIVFMIPVLINILMIILGEQTSFSDCWNNSNKNVKYDSVYKNDHNKKKESIILDKSDYEKGENKSTSKGKTEDISSTGESSNISFNLEHAIQVGDYVHAKENATLQWNGQNLGPIGGSVGAYTEAVNVLNETDYRIYEVYNTLVKYHPELKGQHNREPYQMTDVNNYYHMKVSYIPRDYSYIKKALLQGKLVQAVAKPKKWRNSKGEEIVWPGDNLHWALIFYFDGTYYHMKNAGTIRQKNALYTEEQLKDWLEYTELPHRPIVYEKIA